MKVDHGAYQVSKRKHLTRLLQGSYHHKAQDGKPRLVLTLREWYNDCKAQILAETREICGPWEGNNIYVFGTQFRNR